jgi:hypothetical protein
MGVSFPALSTTSSEDNISLGDKDTVHRRVLWALEGKPELCTNTHFPLFRIHSLFDVAT